MRLLVKNDARGSETEVRVLEIRVDPALPAELFSPATLEQSITIPGLDEPGAGS